MLFLWCAARHTHRVASLRPRKSSALVGPVQRICFTFHGTGRSDCNGYLTQTTRGPDFLVSSRYLLVFPFVVFRGFEVYRRMLREKIPTASHLIHLRTQNMPYNLSRTNTGKHYNHVQAFAGSLVRKDWSLLVWERTAFWHSARPLLADVNLSAWGNQQGVTRRTNSCSCSAFNPYDQTSTRPLVAKGRETITVPTTVVERPSANARGACGGWGSGGLSARSQSSSPSHKHALSRPTNFRKMRTKFSSSRAA